MRKSLLLSLLLAGSLWICNCQRLPTERYSQFNLDLSVSRAQDSLIVEVSNPLACPIHLTLSHSEESIRNAVEAESPYFFKPFETRVLAIAVLQREGDWEDDLIIGAGLGASEYLRPDSTVLYQWPFPESRTYSIMQAYHGNLSHNSDFSRYAIDFDLQVGDTICAARDGVVVGVIEGYDVGGKKRKYRPFANFISLYHEDGMITQYVHLQHNGSFVEIGDSVSAGMPIGLSGKTGFTTAPHLHFNVLKATEYGTVSAPVWFSVGPGASLKPGQKVSHPE